jgi:Phage capsid family
LAALEARSVIADAVVVDTASYWTMMTEATSTFSVVGPQLSLNGGLNVSASAQISLFGIPVVRTPTMPANTGIVGAFKRATMFTGLGYRLDTSTEAGTRWDTNLTGFRAEEEIAFNADPYVAVGRFQRLTNLNT